MNLRCCTFAAVLGIAWGSATASGQNAERQTPRPASEEAIPRTPAGHPDLQGVWSFATGTPLERPLEFGDKVILTEEEAAAYEERRASRWEQQKPAQRANFPDPVFFNEWPLVGRRTSLIVDPPNGRLPPMTAEARERADRMAQERRVAEERSAGPEDRHLWERCIVSRSEGPPLKPTAYNNHVQLFQTPDMITLLHEMIHHVRVIPLDNRPRLGIRQYRGESRGRWEGDVLVVETTNIRADAAAFGTRGASENMRVVERFSRPDADTLLYEFTVDDPTTWIKPWTARLFMTKGSAMYEYACHEGNYALFGILSGARATERAERD